MLASVTGTNTCFSCAREEGRRMAGAGMDNFLGGERAEGRGACGRGAVGGVCATRQRAARAPQLQRDHAPRVGANPGRRTSVAAMAGSTA